MIFMKRQFIFTVCFVVSILALPVSASSDNKQTTQITGHIVDVVKQRIYNGTVTVENGKIINIKKVKGVPDNAKYIMPGFIDAHVHTESSMVRPSEWAKTTVKLGTVAAASDPHEIANVLGIEGVKYMLRDARNVNFHFLFGASPCVPCTPFETSGAVFNADSIAELLKLDQIGFISEMMNVPAVINHDADTWGKIMAAKKAGKPIDGHAPDLSGNGLKTYIAAGIGSDHECVDIANAIEKIKAGMSIMIREGSAARNFNTLKTLLRDYPDNCMLCTDDMNPNDLMKGEINVLVKQAIAEGYPLWNVLKAACINPRNYFKFNSGLLQKGDCADFIVVNNLKDFDIQATYIHGKKVYDVRESACTPVIDPTFKADTPNKFNALPITLHDIHIAPASNKMKVIQAYDGEIVTSTGYATPVVEDGNVVSDPDHDILKVIIYNRYKAGAKPVIAFMKGFNLKDAAIASSVAHDSHNLIAIGTRDELIVEAMNRLIAMRGGQLIIRDNGVFKNSIEVPLPIAGLMSNESCENLAPALLTLRNTAQAAGCTFQDPFMTLSFMALPVIPSLKLSDQGLFDVNLFKFTSLFE